VGGSQNPLTAVCRPITVDSDYAQKQLPYVSRETVIESVMSLVISRIDHCDSVPVGLPASTLAPLQRAQNAAARLIIGLSRRSHVTPALGQLHWLPTNFCIGFEVAQRPCTHKIGRGYCYDAATCQT